MHTHISHKANYLHALLQRSGGGEELSLKIAELFRILNSKIHPTVCKQNEHSHIHLNQVISFISSAVNPRGSMAKTSMDPIRSQPTKSLNLFFPLWF